MALERWAVIGLCAAVLGLAWAGELARASRVASERRSTEARDAALPERRGDGFVGSDRCRACHVQAYDSWHDSWHRTMTQAVDPSTVLAAFDGRDLAHADGPHGVERRGDEFWVRMPDADALLARATGAGETMTPLPLRWQRVVMSTGAHNMQMYWVAATPPRRLLAFPFAWSVEAQTWVANEATLLRPHEPDVVYGWNQVCLKCHAVAGAPGVGEEQGQVNTEVAELGIACEACHGPGAAHVQAQASPLRRYLSHLARSGSKDAGDPTIVHPGRLDGRRSGEICGQCHAASLFADHSTWLGRGSDYRAGAALADSTRVVRHPLRADQPWIEAVLDEDPDYLAGRFWADGMIRISGRDYNGLIESPCHVDEDFTCLSCHEMHGDQPEDQLRVGAREDDNRQCGQCHESQTEALTAHTHHAPASSGSRCVNCHMPHTVYGLTKAIRSHQISSPSVEESVRFGRPNACNGCHLDRSLVWTAAALEAQWGVATTADDLEAAHSERAAAVDWLVRGDAGQRALTAWAFGWGPAQETAGRDWMAPLLLRTLDDDYAAVRWIALRSLRTLPGYADLDWSVAGATLDTEGALDPATMTALDARGPGSERVDPGIYMTAQGFDQRAWAADRAQQDTRVIDLRE